MTRSAQATRPRVLLLFLLTGCAPHSSSGAPGGDVSLQPDAGSDASPDTGAPPISSDAGPACQTPANLAGADVVIAAPFDEYYTIYDLGEIAGVPNSLGGVTVKRDDPNTLLVAGASETEAGQIFEVSVARGPCGHILRIDGAGRSVAQTPFVDANLVYVPGESLMFYSEWPKYTVSQLPPGANAPAVRTDLSDFGLPTKNDEGPGGIGFVPPALAAGAAELRIVTWPVGAWYHVSLAANGSLYDVTGITRITELPNNPGGFAYVPAGSPGFAGESSIVSEWSENDADKDRVAVYDVNPSGDPLPDTRRDFLSKFPRPLGAYFEPLTGDFLFLSWGTGADRVHIIQGFVPPPVVN